MGLRKEKSCGCIIIRNHKVLLVYEKNRNFWGFPKGHMEEGESEIETAQREVKEEVGLDVEIDIKKRYTLNYIINNEIDKTTVLYVAAPKGGTIRRQTDEIEDIRWCDFDEAINTLTMNNWKNLLKKVVEDLCL